VIQAGKGIRPAELNVLVAGSYTSALRPQSPRPRRAPSPEGQHAPARRIVAFISIRGCDIAGPYCHCGAGADRSMISVVAVAGSPPRRSSRVARSRPRDSREGAPKTRSGAFDRDWSAPSRTRSSCSARTSSSGRWSRTRRRSRRARGASRGTAEGPSWSRIPAPARTDSVDLHRPVRRAELGQPRKRHDAAVAQHRHRRIPAPVSHVFQVRELTGDGVVDRAPPLSEPRVVFQIATVDEHPAVGQDHHAITEHVPSHDWRMMVPARGSHTAAS